MGRALVTGANRGIGLELCTLLAQRGDEVLAVCRSSSPELEALDLTVVDGFDLGDAGSSARIRSAIGARPIDLVVANAARNLSLDIDRPDDLDLDLFEGDLRVNVVGAMGTVLAALPAMREGGRVLLVSSGVCAPGNNVPGSFGYKVTKAALNQFGRALAQEIRDRGIVVAAVSPGPTDTAMLRASFTAARTKLDPSNARPARESARAMLATVEAATVETSGSFFDADGHPYSGPDGLPPSA